MHIFDMNGSETRVSGFVTLGQIATRLSVFDVACNHCDLHERLHVDRLMIEHVPIRPHRS
jgi:hypothetical protein